MAEIHRWDALTAPELAGIGARDPVAVWPLGAIEQHGAHLPLSTDVDIAEGLLAAALERLEAGDALGGRPLLILPTLAPAASLEHRDFAGTLAVPAETAIATLEAVGAGVARAGVRRLLLFNSHGGNKAMMDIAALKLRARHHLLVAKASYLRFAPPAEALPARELAHGLHGGALETALMLHFAPGKVRRDRIAQAMSIGERRADAGATLGPEGDAGFAWMAQDLHPSGVAGDARLATEALGARLAAHFAGRLAEIVGEVANFDLTTLGD